MKFFVKGEKVVPFELIVLICFGTIFYVWTLYNIASFGSNGVSIIVAFLLLFIWLLATSALKASRYFLANKFKLLLLFSDVLIYGGLILYVIYLFRHGNGIDVHGVEFLIFLPAASIPLYYDFIPGLIGLSAISIGLVFVATDPTMSVNDHISVLFEVLLYLTVYVIFSRILKSKEKVNKKLAVANEKLVSLDKEKDNFLATAAHELRGPMTILRGYLSLMKTDNLSDSKLKESIDTAYSSATGLMQMINRLLNLNRIRLHKLKLTPAQVEPVAMCQRILEGYKIANTNPAIEYKFVEKGAVPETNLDESLVEEVIVNLINNASKFTKHGVVSLSVLNNPNDIVFSVSDNGPGIRREDMHKIFKKFSQAEGSSGKQYGLGIGLFISKTIVEAHKGKIWVESEYGLGSTFRFSIPKVHSNSVK